MRNTKILYYTYRYTAVIINVFIKYDRYIILKEKIIRKGGDNSIMIHINRSC